MEMSGILFVGKSQNGVRLIILFRFAL